VIVTLVMMVSENCEKAGDVSTRVDRSTIARRACGEAAMIECVLRRSRGGETRDQLTLWFRLRLNVCSN
jgi:hypothetical protein